MALAAIILRSIKSDEVKGTSSAGGALGLTG